MTEPVRIAPQAGPQAKFLASEADIVIYGGAAGGGKSWGLLLEPLRHCGVKGFGAVIFRQTYQQVTNTGGLWPQSMGIYPHVGGKARRSSPLGWTFPSGASVQFGYLHHEDDKYGWQGSEICLLAFDELTHFSSETFWYMFSRNRSTSGIRPYIRATTNPDADSWVAELIAWWIDPESGLPIPERDGVLRSFARIDETLVWGDSPADVLGQIADPELRAAAKPVSFTFIAAKLEDNPALTAKDPDYLAKLLAMPLVERQRLLGGNWKIRASGSMFERAWFTGPSGEYLVDRAPRRAERVRYWDKAGTEAPEGKEDQAGAATAGVKLARGEDGLLYIEHVARGWWRAAEREEEILATARLDGSGVKVYVEQEPGSGGKESAENTVRNLAGYTVEADRVSGKGSKVTRAEPVASQAKAGSFRLVRGEWNAAFLDEISAFPKGRRKDQVDGLSGALAKLAGAGEFAVATVTPDDVAAAAVPAGGPEDLLARFQEARRMEERQARALAEWEAAVAAARAQGLEDPAHPDEDEEESIVGSAAYGPGPGGFDPLALLDPRRVVR